VRARPSLFRLGRRDGVCQREQQETRGGDGRRRAVCLVS